MTDLLTTVQMAGGLIDECVRQYCAELEQLNYDRATISLYRRSIMRLRERMIEHGVALDALTPDIATELVLRADSHGDRRPLCCLRRQALRRLSRNGIVTETGSEASGVSDRMSAWAPLCYRRHRFPPEIIPHAIWLYLRFTLSYRDVEDLLPSMGSTSSTKPSAAGC